MGCYCDFDFDFDVPDVYEAKRPLARRKHVCDECGETIGQGERYEVASCLYEGHWSRFRTCVSCLVLRDFFDSKLDCFCWLHLGLHEAIQDELDDRGYEVPGLVFGYLRLKLMLDKERRTSA